MNNAHFWTLFAGWASVILFIDHESRRIRADIQSLRDLLVERKFED
jgi:hypothetical protein